MFAVGVDHYEHEQDLRFCSADAQLFAQTLEHISGAETRVVTDQGEHSPGHGDIRGVLTDIAGMQAGNDDCVIFYFAGHGFEAEGADFLMGGDSDARVTESAVPTSEITKALRQSGAGLTLMVIDACRVRNARGATYHFGEGSRDSAKKLGILSIFGCQVGEVCQESRDLGNAGNGVFTFALCQLLHGDRAFVPITASQRLVSMVDEIVSQHGLLKQTPEVGVSNVLSASVDFVTGRRVDLTPRPKRLLMVCGLPYSGKSTISSALASEAGLLQIEMSSYASRAFLDYRDATGYEGSIQSFMTDVYWADRQYDRVAQEVLSEYEAGGTLVVSGARRTEEVEAFMGQGYSVELAYLYSDSKTRYQRYARTMAQGNGVDHMLGLHGFIRRDFVENSWGLPRIGLMSVCRIVVNERPEQAATEMLSALRRRKWIEGP